MTFGISTAPLGRGRLKPMSRAFQAFPTTPCDECLGNTEKHLQTDAGLALYCEHEAALALCEHKRPPGAMPRRSLDRAVPRPHLIKESRPAESYPLTFKCSIG